MLVTEKSWLWVGIGGSENERTERLKKLNIEYGDADNMKQ